MYKLIRKSLIIVLLIAVNIAGCGKQNPEENIKDDIKEDGTEEHMINEEEASKESNSNFLLEFTDDYSEDRAWIIFRDGEGGQWNYGIIDKNGNMLFYIEDFDINSDKLTPYSNGYAYIEKSEFLYVIDKEGAIVQAYPNAKWNDKKAVSYADGYVWMEEEVSGFDEAYYKYILYDADGNVLTEFEYEGTDCLEGIYYYGRNVWGYDTEDSNGKYIQRFYCAGNDQWVDSIVAYGEHRIKFIEEEAVIGITYEDPEETGCRAKMHLMSSEGVFDEVSLSKELSWSWSEENYISGDYCILVGTNDSGCLVNYDVSKKQFKKMENEYAEKVWFDALSDKLMYQDNVTVLRLKGNDDENYVALFDTSWNIIGEPIKAEGCVFSENRMIITVNERVENSGAYKEKIKVYDEKGKEVFSMSDLEYYGITPYQDGVARVVDSTASDSEISNVSNSNSEISSSGEVAGINMRSPEWRYIDKNGELLFEKIDFSTGEKLNLQNEEGEEK